MQSHLLDIDDPQVDLHLLRSCLSLCKLNYLLRTVPPDAILESCSLFDNGLCNSLESILHSSFNDASWLQATLPISMGGLGLSLASTSAPVAYVGSLNSTNHLVSLLLDQDHHTPPEVVVSLRIHLKSKCPGLDVNSASQKSLQRAVDIATLLSCKESAPLKDKAHLNTIGTPFTGAWLLVIPNPNLGLTLSKEEFILSVRMWLGCHLFSQSSRCVCGHIIDLHGDHVLGCGLGPLRIKRHDALCDIIWHSLLLDNKGAIKEQRCGESNNRPGDVFHPDFRFGKPAYFDVSVRGSLQPQHLSKAADHPGAAGEAGEIEKDEKHEVDVLSAVVSSFR